MPRLSIFDVSPYIYTAEHVNKYADRSYCGFPLGGLQYFLKYLALDIKMERHIVLCFDARSFRKDIDSGYKAHRKPNYNVKVQLDFLFEELQRAGIPCYKVDGLEADDLIHTAVFQNYKKYDDIYIHGSDKDLAHNIIGDNVFLQSVNSNSVDINKGNFLTAISTDRLVLYNTVSIYKALTGDTSDSIPSITFDDGTTGAQLYDKIYNKLLEDPKLSNLSITLNPKALPILAKGLRNCTENDLKKIEHNSKLVYPVRTSIDIEPLKPWSFNFDKFLSILRKVKANEAMRCFNTYAEQTADDRDDLAKRGKAFMSGEFAVDKNLPMTATSSPCESLFLREFD